MDRRPDPDQVRRWDSTFALVVFATVVLWLLAWGLALAFLPVTLWVGDKWWKAREGKLD